MKVNAYAWKQTADSDEQIQKIINATLPESDDAGLDITYLQDTPDNVTVWGTHRNINVCFGKRAFNIVTAAVAGAKMQPTNVEVVELPELSKLENTASNRPYRLQAWEILKAVKDGPPAVKEEEPQLDLKPEDVAALLKTKLQNVQAHITEDKTAYWMGETLLGKKVLISDKPLTNIPCDFRLTFEELYAAKLAVDILGLKTLTLVKGKQDD